jgi:nicotinate-nucleotide pyrophosphorylase (carboxylating)
LDEHTNMWTGKEELASRPLVQLALQEDLDGGGDVTSQTVLPAELQGQAAFTARAAGVVAGLPLVQIVYAAAAPAVTLQTQARDGDRVAPGQRLAVASGPLRGLLTGERTALNFLQRLSGVATQTRRFVEAAAGTRAKILDTRKTTPGWRLLEKYAVRCGGGHNHRMGLYDGILIKDNHLAGLEQYPDAIARAVAAARAGAGRELPVEIEVDRLDQLDQALACGPDLVLLDNMTAVEMREAVRRRDSVAPGVLLEASGGITLERIPAIAATGVERISVGALTHSAPALDIGLDYQTP